MPKDKSFNKNSKIEKKDLKKASGGTKKKEKKTLF